MYKVLLPLHVTGYWFTVEGYDPLHTGSLGAGINLTPIEVYKYGGEPGVYFQGGDRIIYQTYLESFSRLGINPISIRVGSRNILGRGYGLSGGLAIAAVLLAVEGGTYEELGRYVHVSEVVNRTGYGDVTGILTGGLEVRLSPGAPGIGRVEKVLVTEEFDIISLEVGNMTTPEMIIRFGDRVAKVGPKVHSEFLEDPSLTRFIELSHRFSIETGMLKRDEVESIHGLLNSYGLLEPLIGLHKKKNIILIYFEEGYGHEASEALSKLGEVKLFKIWDEGLVLRND